MRPGARIACELIRLSRSTAPIAVSILRPAELTALSRSMYSEPWMISSWTRPDLVDAGLTSDEQALLAVLPSHNTDEVNVLVLGVGGGREALAFARMGHHVTGIDFIPELVEATMAAAYKRDLHVAGIVQEVSQLSTSRQAFDIVWLSSIMYSCIPSSTRRIATLKQIACTLRDDGHVFGHVRWSGVKSGSKSDFVNRFLARLPCGNVDYEAGDSLWRGMEYIHTFSSESRLRSEFSAGGFTIRNTVRAAANRDKMGVVLVRT